MNRVVLINIIQT